MPTARANHFFLNQMKKLFTFLASAALWLLPAAASAADNQTIDGIDYQFNPSTETYTVAGPASDPTSQVALLAMVDGYPVTSIAENGSSRKSGAFVKFGRI